MISTFIINFIDSIIPVVAMSNIPRLLLAVVAEQASLILSCCHNSEDRFSHEMAPIFEKISSYSNRSL